MMAVFGAPRRAAREGARRGARRARDRRARSPALGSRRRRALSVGVGVATGPAFVGSIRAVDRHIWSALGNTTNLAARLEQLTRDLDVAIAIDAATWQAAVPPADGFEARPGERIRGRSDPVDVYVLPLGVA